MAWYWDTCSFHHSSCPDLVLDQKHPKRKLQSCTHYEDRSCVADILCDGRLHDKRGHPVPSCAVFSAHKGRAFFCKEPAYDFRLLGICIDVSASWVSLEYDDRNAKEVFSKIIIGTEMGRTYPCTAHGRLWNIRFCKKGHRGLYDVKEPFCLF